MRKKISIICIFLSVEFIILGFVSPFLIKNYIIIDGLQLDGVTTWLTGCMSVCFSLSSICLVVVTLNISGENDRKNQFQNRFFKLYDIFVLLKQRLENDYFEKIVKELDEELRKIDYSVIASDSIRDIAYDTCDSYEKLLKRENNKLGEYMGCLFQLMMFIDSEDVEDSEKKFCMNFLSASLSGVEKKVLFYHSLNNSQGKKFHDIIEKYSILWNLDENSIIKNEIIIPFYRKKIYR